MKLKKVTSVVTACTLTAGLFAPITFMGNSANAATTVTREDGGYESLQEEEFLKAMDILASGSEAEINEAVAKGKAAACSPHEGRQGHIIPVIVGAATIIYCVHNAHGVIKKSKWDKNTAVFNLANIIANCAPGMGPSSKVARLIWKHRKQVAAALSSISLAASQAIAAAPQPR